MKQSLVKKTTLKWLCERLGVMELGFFFAILNKADSKGEIVSSERKLSKELGMTRHAVRRFLGSTDFQPLLAHEPNQYGFKIRIENYARFLDAMQNLNHPYNRSSTDLQPPKEKGSSSPSSFPSPSDSPISINTPNTSKEKKIPSVGSVAQSQRSNVRKESSGKGNSLPSGVTRVVLAWKEISEVEDNGTWNRNNFRRHARPAKALIEEMGSVEGAIECMKWVWEWCQSRSENCLISTVAKHVDTYKRDKNKKEKVPWDQMDPSKITKKS